MRDNFWDYIIKYTNYIIKFIIIVSIIKFLMNITLKKKKKKKKVNINHIKIFGELLTIKIINKTKEKFLQILKRSFF